MVSDLKATYGIKYPVCNSTVLVWMHNCGGSFINRKQNYYCDGHENDLNKKARREYIARDIGTIEKPSLRELGQYQWVQMTKQKAEEFINGHAPEVRSNLRRLTYEYISPLPDDDRLMVEFHVESSEMFDVRTHCVNLYLHVHILYIHVCISLVFCFRTGEQNMVPV